MTELLNRECSKYSVFPQVVKPVKRIIAIGDVHGDFKYLIKSLKIANVIDNNNNWIGKDTYVVQVGDQIDNCRLIYQACHLKNATPNDIANDLEIIYFLDKLHEKALKYGGAVISLLGNHEILNIRGDVSYVSYENLKEVDGKENRQKIFSDTGEIGHKIICTHPPAIIIGSNLFVHAGILPEILKLMPELKNILLDYLTNIIQKLSSPELIELFMSKIFTNLIDKNYPLTFLKISSNEWNNIINNNNFKIFLKKINSNHKLLSDLNKNINIIKTYLINNLEIFQIDDIHPIEIINYIIRLWLLKKINHNYLSTIEPLNSIFWNRILGYIPSDKYKNFDVTVCEKYVEPVLKFFKVKHMIIGHTPQFEVNNQGINMTCHNSLIRTDIGGSETFNSFDKQYLKDKNKNKNRIPQVIEITNDINLKILFETKIN